MLDILVDTSEGGLFRTAAFDDQQGQRKPAQTLDLAALRKRAAIEYDGLGPGQEEILGLLQKALDHGVVVSVRVLSAARQQRLAGCILIENGRAGQPLQSFGQSCLA